MLPFALKVESNSGTSILTVHATIGQWGARKKHNFVVSACLLVCMIGGCCSSTALSVHAGAFNGVDCKRVNLKKVNVPFQSTKPILKTSVLGNSTSYILHL